MCRYSLGVDTSCYTTSIAVLDNNRKLIVDRRKLLEVKKGKRGLRQSEALFQHINNLPVFFKELSDEVDITRIRKICCTNKPRNVENSYMPVFTAGVSFAKTISSILDVEYEEYSHQEGHIEAARWSAQTLDSDNFLALHISGGTTEIVMARKNNNRYNIDIIGGTKDISAGQLIDRSGVAMGLSFPSGKEMEKISQRGTLGKIKLPISTDDTYINFSGVETFVKRMIQRGNENNGDIAIALFECICKSLYYIIYKACIKTEINEVLLAGGVASNKFIRDNLYRDLSSKGINLHFGEEKFCTDNAVGTALLGIY